MAKKPANPPESGSVPSSGDPPADPPFDPWAELPLSEDETLFVAEYLIDRNPTHAYQRAFPGTTYQAAARRGRQMRQRPNVAREITEALRAQRIRCNVDADLVLEELARLAFSDILDLFDPNSNLLRTPRHIPLQTRKAIASIKVQRLRTSKTGSGRSQTTTTESVVEYRLWNKNDALQKLAAYLGLNTSIPPLEALLAALPPQLGSQVRDLLRQAAMGPETIRQPSTNGSTNGTGAGAH